MTNSASSSSTLVGIRAAHHPEATPPYDRVVFDFSDAIPLIEIAYVSELVGDASAMPVAINGTAILRVQFTQAIAHNNAGQSTAPDRVAFNLPIINEAVRSGDFEAVVSYGIGLKKKAEIRVMTLANQSRVVIDVFE